MFCFSVRENVFNDDETTGKAREIRLWCEDNWGTGTTRWSHSHTFEMPYSVTKFKLIYEKDATFFALKWGQYLYRS
jgi:hypothetical protein